MNTLRKFRDVGSQQVRHHCGACPHVTEAPLGQPVTTCGGCGGALDGAYALSQVSLVTCMSTAGRAAKRDYARADAEVGLLLATLPLELAAEKRGLR